MATQVLARPKRVAAFGPERDHLMVGLSALHALIFFVIPAMPVIALGIWWNSNTISHNFIHRPFFRRRFANRAFAAFLSVLLGIPQALWRDRHLAHHAARPARVRLSVELCVQVLLVLTAWLVMALNAPAWFLTVYLPGYLAGLGLCALHGYYEHASGVTNYFGKVYNLIFFNDGYHAEHHANPGMHWSRLPDQPDLAARRSSWPAPLRWLEWCNLEGLERLVLRSRTLQRFVLRTHQRALDKVLAESGANRAGHVGIVGGGLFPRTALILRALLPESRLTVIDVSRPNLDRARGILDTAEIEFRHERYTGGGDYDLIVLPLAFEGDREAICARPPKCGVIVHDWIWRRRGEGEIVSPVLLKRVCLVRA